LAAAQQRIVRFHGYDGALFAWSGRLSARAVAEKGGWLEPILAPEDARQWKALLESEGYGGKWSNFLTAAKELKVGSGDTKLKAEILFAPQGDGFRFLAVVPGQASASGFVTSSATSGLPAAANVLGGAATMTAIAGGLGIKDASGRILWQLLSLATENGGRAVLLPSREVVWLETLEPEAFSSVSATTGRPVAAPAQPPAGRDIPPTSSSEGSGGLWYIATIVLGVLAAALSGALLFKLRDDPRRHAAPQPAPAGKSREQEIQTAARRLQQTLVKVPRTDALTWLKDEAPAQLADLVAAATVGRSVLQRLGVKSQAEVDAAISDMLDGEEGHRKLWVDLARQVGVEADGRASAISNAIGVRLGELRAQTLSDEKLMLDAAAKAGVKTDGTSPPEALTLALTKLRKRADEAERAATTLMLSHESIEALKQLISVADQVRQSLHGVRPALADREVFAICGYLLNYSIATAQAAIVNRDEALRTAMLQNIRTISGALAQFEDSFARIQQAIPAIELRFTSDRHEAHADYLTLLQKALDLRALRLSPFVIATDAQGRAYSVTTALA
jgi:hypothetical protein